MLTILFLFATWSLMVYVLVAVLRRGRVTLGDGTIERAQNPKLFVVGVLGPLLIAIAMLAALVRTVCHAIAGTGPFAEHGVFDFGAQWQAGAMLVVVFAPIAWISGRRWLDAKRRRSLRAEIEGSADDMGLPPDDIDFDTIVELYDHAELAAVRDALRAMPPGQRSLRVALDEVDSVEEGESTSPAVASAQAEPVAPAPGPGGAKTTHRYSPAETLSPFVRSGLRHRAWQRLLYFPAIGMTLLPLVAAALRLPSDELRPWLYGASFVSGICWLVFWLQLFHDNCPRCNTRFATVDRVDAATIAAALADRCGACGVPLAAGRGH